MRRRMMRRGSKGKMRLRNIGKKRRRLGMHTLTEDFVNRSA